MDPPDLVVRRHNFTMSLILLVISRSFLTLLEKCLFTYIRGVNKYCGYGYQFRNISCVDEANSAIDDIICRHLTQFNSQGVRRSCFVPCPRDCHLSSWSEWGPCDRPCSSSDQGVKYRSKAVLQHPSPGGVSCDTELVQSEPCGGGDGGVGGEGGGCPLYRWSTGAWIDDRREVWCQSQSGLKVYGACDNKTRPLAIKACSPPCVISHSICADTDRCGCERGFKPRYRRDHLIQCTRLVPNTNNHTASQEPSDSFWTYMFLAVSGLTATAIVVAIFILLRKKKRISQTQDTELHSAMKKSKDKKVINKSTDGYNFTLVKSSDKTISIS